MKQFTYSYKDYLNDRKSYKITNKYQKFKIKVKSDKVEELYKNLLITVWREIVTLGAISEYDYRYIFITCMHYRYIDLVVNDITPLEDIELITKTTV